MSEVVQIPVFPLLLLPMPGELVPLHIFEPRYRQLLQDMETKDIPFGIFCTHELNVEKVGSMMRLETILKRYPGGESDIVVKCTDVFRLDKLFRTYRDKLYPGGDVTFFKSEDECNSPSVELYELFLEFRHKRNLSNASSAPYTLYQMANELNLDLFDRYKFMMSSVQRKKSFLLSHLKFQIHLLGQEEKSRNSFFLN